MYSNILYSQIDCYGIFLITGDRTILTGWNYLKLFSYDNSLSAFIYELKIIPSKNFNLSLLELIVYGV